MEPLAPYVGRICGPIALQGRASMPRQEALITILRGIGGLREPAALFGWASARSRSGKRSGSRPHGAGLRGSRRRDRRTRRPAKLGVDIADTLARLTPEHRAVLWPRDIEDSMELQAGRGSCFQLAAGDVLCAPRLFRARRGFRKAWES